MCRQTFVRFLRSYRGRLAVAVLWLLATVSPGAQDRTLPGSEVRTSVIDLFTGPKRFVRARVTELNSAATQSTVQILFYDAGGRLLAQNQLTVARFRSVYSDLSLNMTERLVGVRVVFRIFGPVGRVSSPVFLLEEINGDSLTIEDRFSCSVPADRDGSVQPNCPDGTIDDI
jgi:hypothetical protein